MAYASLTYRGNSLNTADQATYTFSACAIGTAHPQRLVIVHVGGQTLGGGNNLASSCTCTIGGVAAEQIIFCGGAGGIISMIFAAYVPTGTTADIVPTFDLTMTACHVTWHTCNASSITPIDFGNVNATAATDVSIADLAVINNGCVLFYTMQVTATQTYSWQGTDAYTTDLALQAGSGYYYGALSLKPTYDSTTLDFLSSGASMRHWTVAISLDVEGFVDTLTDEVVVTDPGEVLEGLIIYGGLADDLINMAENTRFAWGMLASDAVGVEPDAVYMYRPGRVISEGLGVAELADPAMKYVTVVTERGGVREVLLLGRPVTAGDTIGIHDVVAALRAASVVERLRVTDALLSKATYGKTMLQGLGLHDSLLRFFSGDIVEGIQTVDAAAYARITPRTLAETVGVASTLSPKLILRLTAADTVNIDDAQLLKMFFRPTLLDNVELAAAYVAPNGNITTWAINTKNFATTEYTNYEFNSFAQMGRKYIGATRDGLYELDGDTDAGSLIVADIKSGLMQLGGSRFTSFKSAYLGMRGSGDFVLKLDAGDGKTYTYAVVGKDMETAKVHFGKGLRARYFSFELISTGQDFDLDGVEFIPLVAQRRV